MAVDYAYDGTQGDFATLRIQMVGPEGKETLFAPQPVRVQRGTGTALLSVFYAGAAAPIELSTDGVSVEMVNARGRIIARQNAALAMHWMRADAHALKVAAEVSRGEGQPFPCAVSVVAQTSDTRRILQAPASMVVTKEAWVTLTAPRTIQTSAGQAIFAGWKGALGFESAAPEVRLTLTSDLSLTARYVLTQKE